MKNIKYVFLGNSQNMKEIGEAPAKVNENLAKEAKTIYTTYCKSQIPSKYEQRNKVVGTDGNYYFMITPSNIFYLVLADVEYPERYVFQLIDEIQRESIYLLVDEKGELNKLGKQSLKNLIENYQNPSNPTNKLTNVQNDINDIKIEMNQNIRKVMSNVEDAEELKKKSDKIKDNSNDFNKKAGQLKRLTCWQNCKWTIILGLLIVGILMIIIIPIAVSKSSSKNPTSPSNSTTSDSF